MIDILKIGTPKTQYPPVNNDNFETLDTYLTLAKKIIQKLASKYHSKLGIEMLKNEDSVSYVATALMFADWKWDENYKGPTGKVKTKYAYRNQYAIWAICNYVKRSVTSEKMASLHNVNEMQIYSVLHDRKNLPINQVIHNDLLEYLDKLISKGVGQNRLSQRNVDIVKLYYLHRLPFHKIATQYNLSKEGVRQIVHRTVKKLKYVVNSKTI